MTSVLNGNLDKNVCTGDMVRAHLGICFGKMIFFAS